MIGIPHRMICNCNNQGNNQGNNQASKKVTLYAAVLLSGVAGTKEGKITTKEIVFDPNLPTHQEVELYLPEWNGRVSKVVVWASVPDFRIKGAWEQTFSHQEVDIELLDNPNITGSELLNKLENTTGVEFLRSSMGIDPEGEWYISHKDKSIGDKGIILRYKFTGNLSVLYR